MAPIPESARELLESDALGHLVTMNEDGSPQVSCVWVGVDGDEVVSGHLPRNRKIQNIERDPRVVLTVEGSEKTSLGLQHYLLIHGAGPRHRGRRPGAARGAGPRLPRAGRHLPSHAGPSARLHHSHRGGPGERRRPLGLGANLFLRLRLRDHLLGEVRRDLLVTGELHRVVAAATGDLAQVARVVEHLGHRHLGLDLGGGALCLHPEGPPAA